MTWAMVPAAAVLIGSLSLVLFAANTVPTAVEGGLGVDGLEYDAMVRAVRTGESTFPLGPYAYRIVAPALVAASGLDVRVGFLALDVAAMLGSALLLVTLLRSVGATPGRTVVAIVWWSALPFGLRYQIHYPVLVDAPAFFLLVATLVAAMRRHVVLFALLLVVGVLTRESLVVLAPLVALRGPQRPRDLLIGAAAAVPALVALLLVHWSPPIAARAASSSTFEFVAFQIDVLRRNEDIAAWRAVAAVPLSLGLLLSPLLAWPRAAARSLGRQPGWTYLAVALTLAAVLGGRDNDRYVLMLSPILLVIAFVTVVAPWDRTLTAAALTGAHLGATRAVLPLTDATEISAGWSPPEQLWPAAAFVTGLCVAGAILWRLAGADPRGQARR